MGEAVHWQPLLHDALAILTSPPDEQIRANGPGCVACDLLGDFDHARLVALGNAELSECQRESLDRIEAEVRTMQPQDLECFNNEAVRRPAWQALRDLAGQALREFGWQDAKPQVFVQTSPGVWLRPSSKD
jgi:hypothetical protein